MPWSRRSVLRNTGVGLTSLAGIPIVGRTELVGNDDSPTTTDPQYAIADRLGANHVDSTYVFTDQNNLNEGAMRLQQLGSSVIKIWFHFLDEKYPHNSEWPDFDDIVDIARHQYLQELFDRPFTTFVLVAYSFVEGDYNHYFHGGITDEQYEEEADSFYRLSKHLLEEYRGTGKEFILQHWQGDWAVLGPEDSRSIAAHDIQPDDPEPDSDSIEGMIRWLNARQEGIERAREEVESDVKVFGATEVNMVRRAIQGQTRIIDAVVPETNIDLVSHNAYRSMFRGFVPPNPNNPDVDSLTPPETRDLLRESLDYVQERTPEPSEYVKESLVDPEKNVFVGEYGFPADKHPGEKARLSRLTTEVSLEWGARWVTYWQLYDEPETGHWLIRDDGSKTPTYDHMEHLIETNHQPDSPSFTRITIDYDRTESDRSFRCFGIDLLDSDGYIVENYNIGDVTDEPLIYEGAFWIEEVNGESCRWFGSMDSRTVLYFRQDTLADVTVIRLDGEARARNAEVSVDGEHISTVPLTTNRQEHDVMLEPATGTPEATSTPTETPTTSTPTSIREPTPTTDSETAGFEMLTTISGLGTAWYLAQRKSDD